MAAGSALFLAPENRSPGDFSFFLLLRTVLAQGGSLSSLSSQRSHLYPPVVLRVCGRRAVQTLRTGLLCSVDPCVCACTCTRAQTPPLFFLSFLRLCTCSGRALRDRRGGRPRSRARLRSAGAVGLQAVPMPPPPPPPPGVAAEWSLSIFRGRGVCCAQAVPKVGNFWGGIIVVHT